MTKEMFIDATEEIMAERFPEQEYWELTDNEQRMVDELALAKVQDKMASIMDEGKERRKYGGE